MGLTEEYRHKVEELEQSVEETVVPRRHASRFKPWLDKLFPIALLVLLVILLAFFIPVNHQVAKVINYLNWAVIAYFTARLGVEFRLRDNSQTFFKNHWTDFLLVFPAFTLLQEVRLLKMLREFEILALEDETVASYIAGASNAGLAAKLTRITRIVKKSLGV